MKSIYEQPMRMLPPYRVTSMVSILAEVEDYNHQMMNIPGIWKLTQGGGVKVAVLDTGLPQHIDLRPVGSKSFVHGYLQDRNGHSTHVGGIIAAIANNGMGVSGIAPQCSDYYGAVLGAEGSGTVNSIIAGIRWAVDVVGAQVINMSLGMDAGVPHLRELENVCNYAANQGCTVVCAAGNEAGGVGQPGIYDSVIAVAAVNRNKEHAWFSNTGPEVDFAAGGVQVYSTWLNDGYARLDGTSMACPAITGVVTLIIADHYKQNGTWLSPSEVYAKLKKIAFDVGSDGYDNQFGYGIPVFQNIDNEPDSGHGSEGSEGSTVAEEPVPDRPEEPHVNLCDGSLIFPLLGAFLQGAGDQLDGGASAGTAITQGLQAARCYWERLDKVRNRSGATTRLD